MKFTDYDISKLTITQTVALLPKQIGGLSLRMAPGCSSQSFNVSYSNKDGAFVELNCTLGKALRSMLRQIKCEECGFVPNKSEECGRKAVWQYTVEFDIVPKYRLFCCNSCKTKYIDKEGSINAD
jgi:hypothetical protein